MTIEQPVALNDNQFAAPVSFAFNCGASNLRTSRLCRKLNNGDYDCVPCELARWVKASDPKTGKKCSLAGLVKRRSAEAALFLKSMDGIEKISSNKMPQK